MTELEYRALPGLSQSGMKDLAISPLRFWHRWLRPDREPEDPTPALIFGSALHCAVLEPKEFDRRYVCEFIAPVGCLITIDDCRKWLIDRSITPKGTKKADVVSQVHAQDPHAPVLDVLTAFHAAEHEGKTLLGREDFARVQTAKVALLNEPEIDRLLRVGAFEVPMQATDPETGVLLKARMDWVRPELTLDLKTFAMKRKTSIDQAVADAIWNEGYHHQAFLYTNIRNILEGETYKQNTPLSFVLAFVESEEPHETRIKVLRSTTAGSVNVYWEHSRVHVRRMIRLYADCMDKFGDKPWRVAQTADPLIDQELKALAWAA